MAGTSRETVSRTLSLLEEKGLVKREGRDLKIFDYSAFLQGILINPKFFHHG